MQPPLGCGLAVPWVAEVLVRRQSFDLGWSCVAFSAPIPNVQGIDISSVGTEHGDELFEDGRPSDRWFTDATSRNEPEQRAWHAIDAAHVVDFAYRTHVADS